jgi:hypothetical protein
VAVRHEVPHSKVTLALGFSMLKPPPIIDSLYSMTVIRLAGPVNQRAHIEIFQFQILVGLLVIGLQDDTVTIPCT